MNNKEKALRIQGSVSLEKGEYNLMASFLGLDTIEENRVISVLLEQISDKMFTNLIIRDKLVEIRIKNKSFIVLQGRVLGGSDFTKPLRNNGEKISPRQEIKILLDKKLDKNTAQEIEDKMAEIIVL